MPPLIDSRTQGKTVSQALIAALQNPALFPHPVEGFQVNETHISWVLLVGTILWGFFGYSTMSKRKDPDVPVRVAAALVSCELGQHFGESVEV